MKRLRIVAALIVAIGSLFWADPAFADSFTDWTTGYNVNNSNDCVQFSYTWGSASKSYSVGQDVSGLTFDINVQNDITNKIGWNGEVFDSYSLQMDVIDAGNVVDTVTYAETSTKHPMALRELVSAYSGHVDSVNVTLSGIDNGFWGGYYGPIMCGPSLTSQALVSSTIPPTTVAPTPSETASPQVLATAAPQTTPSPIETPVPSLPPSTTTPPQNSVSGSADEGWDLTLSAPDGYVFSGVYFASYGVPDNYTAQWCDATTSVEKVAEVFIGQTTGTIASNNGVFGDPCGGTYKRLQVVLTYEPIVPIIVPTPEPPIVAVLPTPDPVIPTPTEEPTVVPTPTPTPTPTVSPTGEPTPTPTATPKPTPVPTPSIPVPTPTPEPSKTPEPAAIIADVATIDPHSLDEQQVAELVTAANTVLAVAEQGSPVYEQALQALAVAAVADDPQLPPALEGVPGAAQVLATFNALGNVGADMAPQVRAAAKKTVIASVIGVQAAVSAVTATTSISTTSTTVRKK